MNYKNMKLLLTGAGGFLGKHIIAELQKKDNYEIIAASSNPQKLIKDCANGKNILIVSNEELCRQPWKYGETDIWINCLYPMSRDGESVAAGLRIISDMLKIIPQHTDYCIDISSQSVYDPKRHKPANENTSVSLSDSYAVGKFTTEQLFDARCGDKCIHIRLASLIGADFEKRFINKFIDKVISKEDIKISGGSQLFGFMDVRDAADGIVTMTGKLCSKKIDAFPPGWGGADYIQSGNKRST